MVKLTASRLQALSEELLPLYGLVEPERLSVRFADAASRLIPCANSSFNRIELIRQGLFVARSRGIVVPVEEDMPLVRYLSQHQVITNLAKRADDSVLKWSDFHTRRAWHKTELFNEYYRRSDTQAQMAFRVCGSQEEGWIVILAVNHVGRRDFGEEDRGLAMLMQRHFNVIYENARRFARWRSLSENLISVVDVAKIATVLLSREGTPLHVSAVAHDYFKEFCEPGNRLGTGIPADIQAWIRQELKQVHEDELATRVLRPLWIRKPTGSLRVSLRLGSDQLLPVLHLEKLAPESSTQFPIQLPSILSPREQEVLQWIYSGKSNPEIATILGISPRTVHKHIEHIFDKLGVDNRYAAITTVRTQSGGDCGI